MWQGISAKITFFCLSICIWKPKQYIGKAGPSTVLGAEMHADWTLGTFTGLCIYVSPYVQTDQGWVWSISSLYSFAQNGYMVSSKNFHWHGLFSRWVISWMTSLWGWMKSCFSWTLGSVVGTARKGMRDHSLLLLELMLSLPHLCPFSL